jgi:hypothetical protein
MRAFVGAAVDLAAGLGGAPEAGLRQIDSGESAVR